jgi:hypothetical protein
MALYYPLCFPISSQYTLILKTRNCVPQRVTLHHTTLATSRLGFLFVAAKIWRHARRAGVSYSDHYEEKGVFARLMDRLLLIAPRGQGQALGWPVLCRYIEGDSPEVEDALNGSCF